MNLANARTPTRRTATLLGSAPGAHLLADSARRAGIRLDVILAPAPVPGPDGARLEVEGLLRARRLAMAVGETPVLITYMATASQLDTVAQHLLCQLKPGSRWFQLGRHSARSARRLTSAAQERGVELVLVRPLLTPAGPTWPPQEPVLTCPARYRPALRAAAQNPPTIPNHEAAPSLIELHRRVPEWLLALRAPRARPSPLPRPRLATSTAS